MIDRKLIDLHPASRLAAAWLQNLQIQSSMTPLLRLTLEYLERVAPVDSPANYLVDLRQQAWELTNQPPDQVAALFCPDWEDLQVLEPDQAWPALREQLDSLYQSLLPKKTLRDVGSLLADNLLASLSHLYPSFGPQKG